MPITAAEEPWWRSPTAMPWYSSSYAAAATMTSSSSSMSLCLSQPPCASSSTSADDDLRDLRARFPWMVYPPSFTATSVLRGLTFEPADSGNDVIVATFVKSGTTWTTYLLHLIRAIAAGTTLEQADAFDDIQQVVVELTWAYDCGQDPHNWIQPFEKIARIFKSHLSPSFATELHGDKAKYVFVLRDPLDVLCSEFNFFQPKVSNAPWIKHLATVDDFAKSDHWNDHAWFFNNGNVYEYHRQAWELRDLPNVMLVCFEDLKEDLPREVARLAQFMGVADRIDADACHKIADVASHAAMRSKREKFDEHWMSQQQVELGRFGPHGPNETAEKVTTNGTTGAGKRALSPEVAAAVQRAWSETVGLSSYEEMRSKIGVLAALREGYFVH
ncbi:sulfotransferase [Pseudoscourfieldia marina]